MFLNELKYYVYGLLDPRTMLPIYVGKGEGVRAFCHLTSDKVASENKFKNAVIKGIRALGLEPIVVFYAKNLTSVEAYNFEAIVIKTYGRRGLDEGGILTNRCTDNRPPSYTAEQKREIMGEERYAAMCQKRSEKQKGVAKTYDCSKNFGKIFVGEENHFFGKTHTEETRKLMSIAKKGKVGLRLGSHHSDEAKAKVSLNNPNRKAIHTPFGEFTSSEAFCKIHPGTVTANSLRTVLAQADTPITRSRQMRSKLFTPDDVGNTPRNLGWYFICL